MSATPPDAPGNSAYLALGDSIPFGYIAAAGHAYINPNNFIGYPEYEGDDLRLNTANAACPGETTGSFMSFSDPDEGCRSFRADFPLHVTYASTQLDFATNFLATHKQTRLLTVNLGANDVFLLQDSCSGDVTCVLNGLPAVLSTIGANMNAILGSLRATGFRGVLMVVNYYSPDYTDPLETGIIEELNQTLDAAAVANGAVVADAFAAFQAAASKNAGGQTCAAGLLNANPQDELLCDDHASQSGQQLLADTIASAYMAASAGGRR
jgi:lysophospholipase L1-like esterase